MIVNTMEPSRRREFFRLRGLVRRGLLDKRDPGFIELRREYDNNRPRNSPETRAAKRKKREAVIEARRPAVHQRKLENMRRWHRENKEYTRWFSRKRYLENKEKIVKQVCEYGRRRRKEDPLLRYILSSRCRVNYAIKKGKGETLRKAVGCDRETFVKHIEDRFQPGMTWDNYGLHGWHIDHIRPVSSFDFTKPEDVNACFHYSNLQPLWAVDNLRKSSSYESTESTLV